MIKSHRGGIKSGGRESMSGWGKGDEVVINKGRERDKRENKKTKVRKKDR